MLVNLRPILRSLWVGLLASSGCLWWAKRKLRGEGAVVALAFHRVLTDADYAQTHSEPEILVRERTFRELAAYAEREYLALDLHEAVPGEPSEKLKVVFTFDDGWWDNYSVALPIARAHRIPLTVFLCPQLVDKSMPFWPERVIALLRAAKTEPDRSEIKTLVESLKKQVPHEREQALTRLAEEANQNGVSVEATTIDRTLSWQEIAQMDRAGVRFGSHTRSHEILTALPADMARREVEGSDVAIEQMLGKPCDAFSYPNGSWSAESRSIVAEAGFKLAVTVDRRIWTADSDPLAIPRSNVYEDDLVGLNGRFSPTMFEYTTIWKAWRRSKMTSTMQAGTQPQTTPATL
jgi:peptidoglycan/xylan/chitin deacetylase (PgdA/CDA1 family)